MVLTASGDGTAHVWKANALPDSSSNLGLRDMLNSVQLCNIESVLSPWLLSDYICWWWLYNREGIPVLVQCKILSIFISLCDVFNWTKLLLGHTVWRMCIRLALVFFRILVSDSTFRKISIIRILIFDQFVYPFLNHLFWQNVYIIVD